MKSASFFTILLVCVASWLPVVARFTYEDITPTTAGDIQSPFRYFHSETERQQWHANDRVPEFSQGFEVQASLATDDSESLGGNPSAFPPLKAVTDNERKHPGDTFSCGFCVCSYNLNGEVVARCTSKFIIKDFSLIPRDTRELIIVRTNMRRLPMSKLLMFPTLSKVTASENTLIIKIDNSSASNQTLPIKELNLSSNNISFIDDGSFKPMVTLQILDLSFNTLYIINSSTFEGIVHLHTLNLSNNNLRHIAADAFDHLGNLRSLDLSMNKHLGYLSRELPPRLFNNLTNLQEFHIHGFGITDQAYPDKALQKLINLRILTVKGLASSARFGPEMKTLTFLTHLGFIGSRGSTCSLSNVTDSFFENLPSVTSLTFIKCTQLRIHLQKSPVASILNTLDIHNIHGYSLYEALNDLKSFQNAPLKILKLSGLKPASGGSTCNSLQTIHAKYLKNLGLEELDLSKNLLVVVAAGFLKELPRTLKRLSLAGNKLIMDNKNFAALLFLLELDISNQNTGTEFGDRRRLQGRETVYTTMQNANHRLLDENITSTKGTLPPEIESSLSDKDTEFSNDDSHRSGAENQNSLRTFQEFSQQSKDKSHLQIVRASHSTYFAQLILSRTQNNVRYIDLSSSFITSTNGHYMPRHVHTADLSNNYCTNIGNAFFLPNNSLVYLSLRNNLLGSVFAENKHGFIFEYLETLTHLDISANILDKPLSRFLKGLKRLQTLKMSDNKIQALDLSFSHMPSLQFLDLSKNVITWVSKETRDDLDNIATLHTLDVDMTGNPLPCTCEGLELLHWMATTNVYFLHKDFLTCRLENNQITKLGSLEKRVRSLQQQCASKVLIIVVCVASIIVLGILIGFAMMYRYRWKLRYLKNIALARLNGYRPIQAVDVRYKFDAFIIYTDESRDFVLGNCLQELEEKRGHKLCVEDRDFIPGTFIISDIISAIQNSTKTVVVVTPDLYEGEYSEYGIKMAVMEEIHTRRSVLHLCVYQPIPDDEMAQCRDLLMVMKRGNYTEFAPEEEAGEEVRQNFWDQLSRAIGHTNNDEEEPRLQPL